MIMRVKGKHCNMKRIKLYITTRYHLKPSIFSIGKEVFITSTGDGPPSCKRNHMESSRSNGILLLDVDVA